MGARIQNLTTTVHVANKLLESDFKNQYGIWNGPKKYVLTVDLRNNLRNYALALRFAFSHMFSDDILKYK